MQMFARTLFIFLRISKGHTISEGRLLPVFLISLRTKSFTVCRQRWYWRQGKIMAWNYSFLLCYEMLMFVLGDSRSTGVLAIVYRPFQSLCVDFPLGTSRFLGGQMEINSPMFAWTLHFQWNMNLYTHGNIGRRISRCVETGIWHLTVLEGVY